MKRMRKPKALLRPKKGRVWLQLLETELSSKTVISTSRKETAPNLVNTNEQVLQGTTQSKHSMVHRWNLEASVRSGRIATVSQQQTIYLLLKLEAQNQLQQTERFTVITEPKQRWTARLQPLKLRSSILHAICKFHNLIIKQFSELIKYKFKKVYI